MGLERSATESQIKKAYFKLALKCHPDKCPGDESAHTRFQALGMVHSVLSDPERRALYDETGEVADGEGEFNQANFDMWYEYYRNLFPKVTTSDIDKFKGEYQGSEEEKGDIIKAYVACKGDMAKVIDTVMLSGNDDAARFGTVIEEAIAAGDVKSYAAFKTSLSKLTRPGKKAKTSAKAEKEAKEAEELAALLKGNADRRNAGGGGGGQLTRGAQHFDSMIASLEGRYASGGAGKKAKGGRGKAAPEGPPDMDDAEFERIQARLMQGAKSGGGGGKKRR
ncbi:hypothetical protein JKP88DRAFT_304194 [Tribonema minus]|uniref:J domain-containing protein n=1 Tax=Tribonema minus TaxID=303371 RepID=A0A835ZGE5_9STRA|nr:hypothetical protein JKP88DRAFT_304194 [Tribonema minus]